MVCTHIQNGRWIRDERRGYEKAGKAAKLDEDDMDMLFFFVFLLFLCMCTCM